MPVLQTDIAFLRQAYEVIENLDRLSTTDEVIDAMQVALARFGFEFFCFNTFPQRQQTFLDVKLACRIPSEWLRLYQDKGYIQVDPSIRFCQRTFRLFEWKDAPFDPEREPRAAEVVRRATDFGLSHGYLVPIHGPAGCDGDVWMGGYKLDLEENCKPMLHLVALSVFDRVRGLHAEETSADAMPLTSREREVLTWAAQGKSAWETGEILNISKRTIDEHLQTACRKLNAVNKTQAVVVALRERLIAL